MTITEKGEHMIDEKQLDKSEAITFILLLTCERVRHTKESITASMKLQHVFSVNGWKQENLIIHFWQSCVTRHEEDIILINKTISYLEQKFNLEG